jgi:TolB protein
MSKFRQLIFIFSLWLVFPSGYAMLDLELTQGVTSAQPIAIIPFSGGQVFASGNIGVSNLIKKDLQNSGEFNVLSPQPQLQQSKNTAPVNATYWRKKRVDSLVQGSIQPLGRDQYKVNFKLINTYVAKDDKSTRVLIDRSFQVDKAGLRNLSHHISDLIYQKLIGVKGIFSTKVAYVLVQRHPGQPVRYSLDVSDIDGFNPHTLLTSSEPIMSPTWTPNAAQLAYVSFEKHRATVYLQDVATGRRQRLSEAPGINGAPAFSPDGSKLALVLSKTGNPKIYIVDINSKKTRELTFGWSIDTEPNFSADGKNLLFTSNRDGSPQIYDYNFKTKKTTRLTYNGNYNARASFLPGADAIVMMHRGNGLFGIATQDLASGRVSILTQTGLDESPSVAPNGKMVIYATKYGGRGVLAQVSVDGRIKLRLPAQEGVVQEPAWSPFI